jgi:hypothetical protein
MARFDLETMVGTDAYGRPLTEWTVVIDLPIDQAGPPWAEIRAGLLAYIRDEEPPEPSTVPWRRHQTARFTLTRPRDPDEAPETVADAWIAELQQMYDDVRRLAPLMRDVSSTEQPL